MTFQDLKQIAKTITIEDIAGAVSIFAALFVCLAWVWVAT